MSSDPTDTSADTSSDVSSDTSSDVSSSGSNPSPFDPPDPTYRVETTDERVVSDPDAPVIIGVSFDSPIKAQEYLLAMGRLRQQGDLQLKDAVVVTKDQNGKVNVTETLDPTPGRAAMSGAVWTGLIGLFVGGPVGWLAGLGLGAGAGAITAKVVDLGVPDEWVDWFKEAVEPGRSALVILADHVHVPHLATEARRFAGAELLYTSMSDSAMEQLEEAFAGE